MSDKKILLTAAALMLASVIDAKIVLPSVISDGMVLQRESSVNIWGMAKPSDKVSVSVSWSGEIIESQTLRDGSWSVSVRTPSAGGPFTMTVKDSESEVEVRDIMSGEVWICAGQSNMSMPVKGFQSQPCTHPLETAVASGSCPQIRMFTAKQTIAEQPEFDVSGSWLQSSPGNTLSFSAVGFYYALNLSKALGGIPVGMINISWGGSNAEAWSSRNLLEKYPSISLEFDRNSKSPQRIPTALHNGMFRPVSRFGVRGVIWYQGEHNRNNRDIYASLFPAMVNEWRQIMGQGQVPFYYVQIAPYEYSDPDAVDAPLMMELQWRMQYLIPESGVVPTLDLGEEKYIHYSDKASVGLRLAVMALSRTYGMKGLPSGAAYYRSMEIIDGKIVLTFDNAAAGLVKRDYETKNPFEICGDDGKYVPAKFDIHPKYKDKVMVWADGIRNPSGIRYAFRNWSEATLFDVYGIPVPPFRTDNIKY